MPAFCEDPELEARVRARVGTTLREKYTLDSVLGIGGMAAVYSATHRNGRQVAVKLLHPSFSMHTEAKTRFSREGLVANKVRHPGVVAVLDDDVAEDGAAFLVMELLEGHTLEELWEQQGRRLPLPAVLAAGIALLDILGAAHAAGVIHRDIKPANLFLTHQWQVKVLDFGISRLQAIQSATSTQAGMAMGSPAFMAPEQALGRLPEIDGRTDLWSAAASLFTLASGEYVHQGMNGQEMLIRAATTPVRSLAAALPGAPGLITAVIDRALSFRREERWASAAEMCVALSEATRATFGEEPSVGAFAALLQFVPPTSGPTAPLAARVSAVHAFQSTQLTSSASLSLGEDAAAKRRRRVILGAVAGFGLLAGFSVVAARLLHGSAETGPGADGRTTTVQAAAVATTAATVPVVPSPAHTTDEAPSAIPPPLPPPRAAPAKVAASPRAAPSKPSPTPAPSPPSRPQSSFLPPSTQPAPAADPCNPPYRLDFFGNRVTKPGCQ